VFLYQFPLELITWEAAPPARNSVQGYAADVLNLASMTM
jgi:hypothetical protein